MFEGQKQRSNNNIYVVHFEIMLFVKTVTELLKLSKMSELSKLYEKRNGFLLMLM